MASADWGLALKGSPNGSNLHALWHRAVGDDDSRRAWEPGRSPFAGIYIADLDSATEWYRRQFGIEPSLFPNDVGAAWELTPLPGCSEGNSLVLRRGFGFLLGAPRDRLENANRGLNVA